MANLKTTATLNETDNLSVTVSHTTTLRTWKTIRKQLDANGTWQFGNKLAELIKEIEQTFSNELEIKE